VIAMDGLRIQGLSKRFGHTKALTHVNLDLPPKGIIGLIGPNGAGKSTLLDILAGFSRPEEGSIFSEGSPVPLSTRRLTALAVRLHQSIVVPDRCKARQFLSVVAGLGGSGLSRLELPQLPFDLLHAASVNLESEIQALSWGQKRVVSISACFVTRKPVLLLDEPFAGLAPIVRDRLCDLLRKEAGTRLLVIAEHDLETLLSLTDLLVVMVGGIAVRSFHDSMPSREDLLCYFVTSSHLDRR
jgi:ABC-type multidrug transport system ATPase subunit